MDVIIIIIILMMMMMIAGVCHGEFTVQYT